MSERVETWGIVLKTFPMGEADKRLTVLTKDLGKIAVLAHGARKANSRFVAQTEPFCAGGFSLYRGRSFYHLREAHIDNAFPQLRTDPQGACYGMYFAELCDACARENNDELQVLILLYQSLRALCWGKLDRRLVRCIFEIKLVALNGEFAGVEEGSCSAGCLRAVRFIVDAPPERLFSFTVTQQVLQEIALIADRCRKTFLPGNFQSLRVLESLI